MTAAKIVRVRDSHIRQALARLNGDNVRGIGYSYYADIKGDGRNIRSVWTIINSGGGVVFSYLNGKTMRETLNNIEKAITEKYPTK